MPNGPLCIWMRRKGHDKPSISHVLRARFMTYLVLIHVTQFCLCSTKHIILLIFVEDPKITLLVSFLSGFSCVCLIPAIKWCGTAEIHKYQAAAGSSMMASRLVNHTSTRIQKWFFTTVFSIMLTGEIPLFFTCLCRKKTNCPFAYERDWKKTKLLVCLDAHRGSEHESFLKQDNCCLSLVFVICCLIWTGAA